MNKTFKDFKNRLSVPVFENYCKSIYNLLKSKPYENYTDVVLSTLGTELENYFLPDEMRLKYRYKSKNSLERNISKDSKIDTKSQELTSEYNKYITYDIIGMRLVIERVPDNFKINDEFIEKSKENLENTKLELTKLKEKYFKENNISEKAFEEKCTYLKNRITYLKNCTQFNNLIKERKKIEDTIFFIKDELSQDDTDFNLKKDEQIAQNLLNNINNTIGMIAGEYAINNIFSNSENIKKLGLYLDPKREKFFCDKTGYTSTHFCIKSTKMPNWICELQNRSSLIEYQSKYGLNTHDKLPGKKRKLINLPSNNKNAVSLNKYLSSRGQNYSQPNDTISIKNFFRKLDEIIPHYTKYTSNGYIKKYTTKENTIHYYKKFLGNRKQLNYRRQLEKIFNEHPENSEIYLPNLDIEKNEKIK